MFMFLGDLKKIKDTCYKIGSIHYQPFHDKYGMQKNRAELEEEGILLENRTIPSPQNVKGKRPVLCYELVRKELYYEYEDIPKSKEEQQQELNAKLLKDSANMQIELNKQKELNSTLLLKIAQLGGKANA